MEIVFRDQYLSRADMWRLTVSELSNRSVYKGQRILFMGTIKATVKSIYSNGKRINSAFFSSNTKPIFRSESAKYVIFIQMSREMWDFDAEGSGEIMFSKVINGFLPDLFKRWQKLNVRHLVSLVLFTRLEYDEGVLIRHESDENSPDGINHHRRSDSTKRDFRDYYRVVTTEAHSGKWVDILYRLKKEFLVFLRDVSIVGGADAYGRPPETLAAVKASTDTESVIAGQPTTAAKGNILEAINLASSQFTKDYVDRDLVRTGLSLAIITAGTGVFEVDYNMLKLTTDSLVGSGIGVDIVSLARMPLHSVPLFRYRSPHTIPYGISGLPTLIDSSSFHAGSTPRQHSFLDNSGGATFRQGGRFSFKSGERGTEQAFGTQIESGIQWSYALPHWIDVSFWTGHSEEAQTRAQHGLAVQKSTSRRRRPFTTSCRMYELQMMGLMENEMSDIAISFLPQHIHQDRPRQLPTMDSSLTELGLSESVGSMPSFLDSQMESPNKRHDGTVGPMDTTVKKDLRTLSEWMSLYDEETFKDSTSPSKPIFNHATIEPGRSSSETLTRMSQSPTKVRGSLLPPPSLGKASSRSDWKLAASPPKSADALEENMKKNPVRPNVITTKRVSMPRQISLGPRSLGTAKSVPSTSISTENAGDLRSSASEAPPAQPAVLGKFSSLTQQLLNTLSRKPSQASLTKSVRSQSSNNDSVTSSSAQRSTPIAIKEQPGDKDIDSSIITVRDASVPKAGDDIIIKNASAIGRQTGPRADTASISAGDKSDVHKTLSPLSAMSPWLTMLNPSNPRKHNMNIASQYRRWQHVYPRAMPTSAIKWKSLCSPASLPLTAEYFPNAEQLKNDYHEYIYKLMPIDDDEFSEAPRTREALIRELIGCRLSHGFQIVIGAAADEFVGTNAASLVKVFDKDYMAENGATVLMTIGHHLHQLLCTEDGEIEVRRYIRKPVAAVESVGAVNPSVTYTPYIRTFLASDYQLRPTIFKNPRPTYYWNAIDHHLAGYEQNYTSELRYWRTRFVLIPVDPKVRGGQLGFVSENSDEEIRLEGIQKLTQLWQRHRYIPPEERRFQQSVQQRKKDPNPLAIEYQTRDPSQIVRSHAQILADALLNGESGQELFSEVEQYHTSDFDMAKLAQHLQSDHPKGIRLADRRWHWRTHHRCFRGDDLTSWLLSHFKDIDTRQDAVNLGDELMKRGLFTHVMQKHQFRDGNYFYQIAGQYSTVPLNENKNSWFSTGRSVPSTPMLEGPKGSPKLRPRDSPRLRPWESPILRPRDSPRLRPRDTPRLQPVDKGLSRLALEDFTDLNGGESSYKEQKKRPKLQLSRVLRYDVDHRKRSYRQEIINLHYDRIHNPENCYHIRIDWMNVTAKLIEDAITSWAASVERYGLRMVEVPLAEGFALLNQHPFRRPYIIELCVAPPKNKIRRSLDTDSLASQQTQEESRESHPYSREILRHFDFVLDMEAASNFDPGVDVSYSWGKPDYRYTQFIHKSGGLFIQINDEGNFMLCANRLCADRSSVAREAGKYEKHGDRQDRRGTAIAPSPYASPMVRPVQDTPARAGGKPRFDRGPDLTIDPESVKDQLEELCNNPQKLQEFYDHAFLKQRATPSPSPHQTPVLDANIPAFGLPPAITLRNISFAENPRGVPPTNRRPSIHGFRSSGGE